MRELQQNKTKKLAAMLILLAVPFFVMLGMRIAYIKGDFEKAKQRPRAVTEETHKQFTKLIIVKQNSDKPALYISRQDVPTIPWVPVQVTKSQLLERHPVALHDLRRIPPRASPLLAPAPPCRTA